MDKPMKRNKTKKHAKAGFTTYDETVSYCSSCGHTFYV